MNLKTVLSWIAFVVGEAVIVAAFYLWLGDLQTEIFALDLTVTTIIYFLSFIDMLFPWLRTGDKSHRIFGSMGIRWFTVGLYSLLAIAAMVVSGMLELEFTTRLIIQCALLFLLLLGFVAIVNSSDRVANVHREQAVRIAGVARMRDAVSEVMEEAISKGLPEDIVARISELNDNMRYISPSDTPEASDIEAKFIAAIMKVRSGLSDYRLNRDSISEDLSAAERLYKRRKSVYSI